MTLLDNRNIPTRRRDGILISIPKNNHYKFPKNHKNLRVDVTFLPTRELFKKVNKESILDPYIKMLRIDYGDGRVIKGSSTKMMISQLWNVIFRHAIHH